MKKIFLVLTTLIATITLFSCKTTKEIPADLTAAQLIQTAQNCYEKADYNGAITYYDAILERFDDMGLYTEVTYEIGHTYLKMKKYDLAYECFMEVLAVYSQASYGVIPSAYKKLAEIGISNIPEKKLESAKAAFESLQSEIDGLSE